MGHLRELLERKTINIYTENALSIREKAYLRMMLASAAHSQHIRRALCAAILDVEHCVFAAYQNSKLEIA
jgi:hypothetical protein